MFTFSEPEERASVMIVHPLQCMPRAALTEATDTAVSMSFLYPLIMVALVLLQIFLDE